MTIYTHRYRKAQLEMATRLLKFLQLRFIVPPSHFPLNAGLSWADKGRRRKLGLCCHTFLSTRSHYLKIVRLILHLVHYQLASHQIEATRMLSNDNKF